MKNNRIDVIIPAYKAQGTILRTLCSIAEQTVVRDVDVTIANDCCPEGDYTQFVEMFKPFMSIKEIKLEKNGGAGAARQYGIDNTENEFFTCIDADDTFCGAIALETLREGIQYSENVKCCAGTFYQLGETLQQIVTHSEDMVWMFGKIYRRDFIDKYHIRFNSTRANEDTGFNTIVKLLCDNESEQVRFISECVYYWHNNDNSITRINNGQYTYDQCLCGWTDNMIYAFEHVRYWKPFSGIVNQTIIQCLFSLYFYYVETLAHQPVFAEQNWEYVKKFYHTCYKRIEGTIRQELFAYLYSIEAKERWASNRLQGVIPQISIQEFMEHLKSETYDPDYIYDVWERMSKDPNTEKLLRNNTACGVCKEEYWKK